MRREPRNPHRSARPGQLGLRLLIEHAAHHSSRRRRLILDPAQQRRMVELAQRLLPLLPGPGPFEGATILEGGEVMFDLLVVATDVRGEVVGRPPGTRGKAVW